MSGGRGFKEACVRGFRGFSQNVFIRAFRRLSLQAPDCSMARHADVSIKSFPLSPSPHLLPDAHSTINAATSTTTSSADVFDDTTEMWIQWPRETTAPSSVLKRVAPSYGPAQRRCACPL